LRTFWARTIATNCTELSKNPQATIPKLRRLIEQVPDVPIFYNWLAMAYIRVGDERRANEMVRENYRRNPDYLFARLNYGHLCLQQGDVARADEVMEHKFTLSATCFT
jgi:predicted Zn-dependent protease